jgi:hypothetical protein
MALHFQEEINLKRDLIEEEKRLDNLTQDLQEKEYSLFKYSNEKNMQLKTKDIKKYITRLNEQINMLRNSIDMKVQQQSELLKRRDYIQAQVNVFSKDPMGVALGLNYQYYILTLSNLSLEYKKYQNNNNLKVNEIKVNKLINQVRLRDEVIKNIDGEVRRKNLVIPTNQDMRRLSELNIEHSIILPTITKDTDASSILLDEPRIYSSHNNMKAINKSMAKSASPTSRSNLNYESYNNPYILKEKKKFKTKTSEIIEQSKKHQLNEFKLNLLNELYPSSKIKYLTSNRQGSSNDRVIEFKAPSIIQRDKSNTSLLSSHSSPSKNNSRIEREMDKKSKNILKRNIISRYRNSPYISQVIK